MDRLRRVAATAPVPVSVALGHGADAVLAELRADARVDVTASPRHATVLVVAGHVPEAAVAALGRVHDQVPAPRATVVVDGDPARLDLPAATATTRAALVDELVRVHAAVVTGQRHDSPVGPADNPVDWQGIGPHGQGGEGMMGGVPWGRPMAMPPTAGRDGLALDRLALVVGPFLAVLPPMLEVEVGLQGDVLEDVELRTVPPDPHAPTPPPTAVDSGLVALAELLALVGLGALATTAARLARTPDRRVEDVAALRHRLDRPWGLRLGTDDLGRLDLPGVAPDPTDRWRDWLASAASTAVGDTHHAPGPVATDEVASQLVGMEVGHAVLTLVTLRPQLAASAVAPAVSS